MYMCGNKQLEQDMFAMFTGDRVRDEEGEMKHKCVFTRKTTTPGFHVNTQTV